MLTSIKSIEVSDPALACRFPYQQDLYLQQLLTISDFYFFFLLIEIFMYMFLFRIYRFHAVFHLKLERPRPEIRNGRGWLQHPLLVRKLCFITSGIKHMACWKLPDVMNPYVFPIQSENQGLPSVISQGWVSLISRGLPPISPSLWLNRYQFPQISSNVIHGLHIVHSSATKIPYKKFIDDQY